MCKLVTSIGARRLARYGAAVVEVHCRAPPRQRAVVSPVPCWVKVPALLKALTPPSPCTVSGPAGIGRETAVVVERAAIEATAPARPGGRAVVLQHPIQRDCRRSQTQTARAGDDRLARTAHRPTRPVHRPADRHFATARQACRRTGRRRQKLSTPLPLTVPPLMLSEAVVLNEPLIVVVPPGTLTLPGPVCPLSTRRCGSPAIAAWRHWPHEVAAVGATRVAVPASRPAQSTVPLLLKLTAVRCRPVRTWSAQCLAG